MSGRRRKEQKVELIFGDSSGQPGMSKEFPRAKSQGKQSTFWWNGERAANTVLEISSVIRQYATLRAFFDGFWWEVPESTFWGWDSFTTEARRHRDSEGQKSTFGNSPALLNNPRISAN